MAGDSLGTGTSEGMEHQVGLGGDNRLHVEEG